VSDKDFRPIALVGGCSRPSANFWSGKMDGGRDCV
jgi:hypothetical protein